MTFENNTMDVYNYSGTSNQTQEITSDTGEKPVTIAIFICLGIIGCLGNGFVLYVFSSSEKLRKSIVNIYLINQSAIDLIASLMFIATAKGVTNSTGWSADRIEGKFTFLFLHYHCLFFTLLSNRPNMVLHKIWQRCQQRRTQGRAKYVQ